MRELLRRERRGVRAAPAQGRGRALMDRGNGRRESLIAIIRIVREDKRTPNKEINRKKGEQRANFEQGKEARQAAVSSVSSAHTREGGAHSQRAERGKKSARRELRLFVHAAMFALRQSLSAVARAVPASRAASGESARRRKKCRRN